MRIGGRLHHTVVGIAGGLIIISALLVAAALLSVSAQEEAERMIAAPDGLTHAQTARVVEIIDGDTVVLDDGAQVRLVGIQAPKRPLGRTGFVEWPLAPQAHALLGELVLGRTVTLAFGGAQRDRHGRWLAHLIRDDGLWVQGAMLAAGLARVYSFADNRSAVAEMLTLEAAARADQRGVWDHPFYTVRTPETAGEHVDEFALVEGRVLAADRVRDTLFLNFGADYRTDFTVRVEARDLERFDDAGLDLLALDGRTVRVRGWIFRWNGPMIEADHPEQIEVF